MCAKSIYLHHSSPFCQHFNSCSGCLIDLKQDSPPPIWNEVVSYFQQKYDSTPFLHLGSPTGWRHRAKLAVRGTAENPLIGLFKAHSHQVIPIPLCQVHHPAINQAVEFLRCWMINHHLQPYNEKTGRGDLRYLQFVVERKSGKVQVSFVLNFKDLSSLECQRWMILLKELEKTHSHLWHSIWLNLNVCSTNTIVGEEWHKCWGEEFIWETFGHLSVCYQPSNFAQANLDLFERMLNRLLELVPNGSKVAEFYAGIGVIGLFLAHKCGWVKCTEINPHSEFCFSLSKAKLSLQEAEKIHFYTGSADELIGVLEGADLAIVDPPRKGLDPFLLQALNQSPTVKKLIYVSCGWTAFKKDCDELLLNKWRLERAEGYLFFPGSNHIEILASFKRECDV